MASVTPLSIIVNDNTSDQVGSQLIGFQDASDPVKMIAAESLGVEVAREWCISDRSADYSADTQKNKFSGLVMTHVVEQAPPNEETIATFGHLHGAVVDLATGQVVAPAYGYPQTAVVDSCEITPAADGSLTFEVRGKADPEEKRTVTYAPGSYRFAPMEDGILLRVFYRNGTAYHASHTKMKVDRSKWGNTKSFMEMYTEAKGPTESELFDLSVPNSSTVYYFLVVHPELRVASRRQSLVPFILHLASVEVPCENSKTGIFTSVVNPEVTHTGGVSKRQDISLADANILLRHGHFPYPQSNPFFNAGETVTVYTVDEAGIPRNVIRVCGMSYWIRFTLRGDNPSIPHRYRQLLDTLDHPAETPFGLSILSDSNVSQIFADLEVEAAAIGAPIKLHCAKMTRKAEPRLVRASNIHQLYLWSLPPHFREQASRLYAQYLTSRTAVTSWLSQAILSGSYENLGKRGEFIRDIMFKRHFRGSWDERKVKADIATFISKEFAPSLYQLDRQRLGNIYFAQRRAEKSAKAVRQ